MLKYLNITCTTYLYIYDGLNNGRNALCAQLFAVESTNECEAAPILSQSDRCPVKKGKMIFFTVQREKRVKITIRWIDR